LRGRLVDAPGGDQRLGSRQQRSLRAHPHDTIISDRPRGEFEQVALGIKRCHVSGLASDDGHHRVKR